MRDSTTVGSRWVLYVGRIMAFGMGGGGYGIPHTMLLAICARVRFGSSVGGNRPLLSTMPDVGRWEK